MEMPGAACFAGFTAESIALSRLLGIMSFDLWLVPEHAVSREDDIQSHGLRCSLRRE